MGGLPHNPTFCLRNNFVVAKDVSRESESNKRVIKATLAQECLNWMTRAISATSIRD